MCMSYFQTTRWRGEDIGVDVKRPRNNWLRNSPGPTSPAMLLYDENGTKSESGGSSLCRFQVPCPGGFLERSSSWKCCDSGPS
jgi:hypothetical protein